MIYRLARWLPAGLWMALLYYLSDQPRLIIDDLPTPGLFHILSHIGAYAMLGWLLAVGAGSSRRGLWIAFWLAAGYGALDEWHQSFVPGRGSHLWQVGLDAASAGAALLILDRARRLRAGRLVQRDDRPASDQPAGQAASLLIVDDYPRDR